METFLKAVGAVVVGAAILAVVAFAMAYPTQWLVNYLVAPSALMAVFGIPALTFWKALALNWVATTLFKGSCSSSSKK